MKYFLLFFLFAATSCKKDFLDPKNTNTFNRQSYVNSLSTMEHFSNGIQLMLDRDLQRSCGVGYGDIIADNLKPASAANPGMHAHYAWSQKASESIEGSVALESTAMNGEWKSGYLDIRACNFVIEDIDKYRNENPARADKMKGQAYAIRAMVHLKLVNIFAQTYSFTPDAGHIGIPYITTSDITVPYTRQSVSEVYSHIINDLQEAIKLMPPGIPDARFMNQSAAKALLARIYLFKGDYELARRTALEVTTAHPLMTIAQGYPDKLYDYVGNSPTETLYQLTPTFSDVIITSFAGNLFRGFSATFRPTKDIVNMIRENPHDIRNNWLLPDGVNFIVAKYPMGITGLHLIKTSDYYHTVLRSSEMFLTVAEAAFNTHDENTARQYLNAIRKRADPASPDVTAIGEALRDSIYKERRKELAFEGGRMYDLQRWHKGVQRMDLMQGSSAASLPYPGNKAIAPIPMQDVRIGGLSQNKDY